MDGFVRDAGLLGDSLEFLFGEGISGNFARFLVGHKVSYADRQTNGVAEVENFIAAAGRGQKVA